jgi:predicted nucleic acid-binding protein
MESRKWWANQLKNYEVFISAKVVRELSEPAFKQREEALALAAEAQNLPITDDVKGLAMILVREKVMPAPQETGDAVHAAVAIVHKMDYLLTWNQRHLANRNKVAHLREICRRVGYVPPDITTPASLWDLSDKEPA